MVTADANNSPNGKKKSVHPQDARFVIIAECGDLDRCTFQFELVYQVAL